MSHMSRITQKDLERLCTRVNYAVNGERKDLAIDAPWPLYERTNGNLRQLPNVYSISYAYGGAALYRNCDVDASGESHGVHDIFGYHMPKRELWERMQAFLRGIEAVA